jgi:hypothetical protein
MRHVPGSVLFVLTAMLSVALMGSVSRAEGVRVPNAFMTGQQYLALSASSRATYIMGLLDGIFVGPLFGASEARVLAVQTCLQGRNNVQIAAILSKYIQDKPERWHEGANTLFYSRMVELCPEIILGAQ